MIKEEFTQDMPEVFFQVDQGEYIKVNMSLPLQMLFDDVLAFVSTTEM